MLSPSLHFGAISRLWGNQLLQYIEANTWSLDFHIFFHSGTTPLILFKTSVSHPSDFFWCSGTTLFWLPHSGTPSNSSGFFPFLETSIFGNIICCRQDNSLLRDLPMESSFMGQSISS